MYHLNHVSVLQRHGSLIYKKEISILVSKKARTFGNISTRVPQIFANLYLRYIELQDIRKTIFP